MYQLAIDGDFGLALKMVTTYSGLKMNMVKNNFGEIVGESMAKRMRSLQTMNRELVSRVESELLCRAHFRMYLKDDSIDKDAREMFRKSMLSFF
ncbi:chalcone isomerase-like protein 1 [Humulus lupulus]|uniref:chalcone isomerase-like protein 1 n=1 Tax=Humulus lupulus TaxID=3486 RepID=UPI002B406DD8|nr:chalcone isomerase-like protein 1 [Humulus lupulus]